MIDPRLLQQHFKRVHINEQPLKPEIPRVPDIEPLTAARAIPIPVVEEKILMPAIEQKNFPIIPPIQVIQAIPQVKQKESTAAIIETEPCVETATIKGIETPSCEALVQEPEQSNDDTYDPYGYYSGPVN